MPEQTTVKWQEVCPEETTFNLSARAVSASHKNNTARVGQTAVLKAQAQELKVPGRRQLVCRLTVKNTPATGEPRYHYLKPPNMVCWVVAPVVRECTDQEYRQTTPLYCPHICHLCHLCDLRTTCMNYEL